MLNINSPTVQAMMNNIPQGMGNMPAYFGNSPTVEQVQQQPTFSGSPYPSPKEMLMQSACNNIYQQTTFGNNIVGGYNPGFNAAFSGYSNPYMPNYIVNPYYAPMDYETSAVNSIAMINGMNYYDQVCMDSQIYKMMSRVVSTSMNRSEEEIKQRESLFDVFDKRERDKKEQQAITSQPLKMKHVKISLSDGREVDVDPSKEFRYTPQFINRSDFYDMISQRSKAFKQSVIQYVNNIHNNAIERTMDDMDLVDLFNNGIGSIISSNMDMLIQRRLRTNSSFMYSRNAFKENLLKNNGCKSAAQLKAIDKFTGRYGIMPDGRPVSPGHDPSIAESFTYDTNSGQITISPPNFIANRIDLARARFIQSIE